MASFLQALESKIGIPGRKVYEKRALPDKFSGLDLKGKLQSITGFVRTSDREQRIRRNTVYYLMDLYYQGYQNVDLNPNGNAFDVYEKEDFYVENQFRRHVDAVINMLSKGEGDVVCRPGGDRPEDIASAQAAGPILEIQKDAIGYERVRDIKNKYKALFGNAFVFTDYVQDKKYGSVTSPKYSYQEVADPEGGDPFLTKVMTGFETHNRGSEVSAVCSPLEISCRPDVKQFEDLPWIQWVSRQDIEVLNYVYPGLGLANGSSSVDADLAQQYLEVLANLPGNVLGDSLAYNRGTSQVKKAEFVRTWLQPCMFAGDRELLREFPDGVHVVTVNGEVVDYYPENLLDRWTHEVLIPNPHSLFGDGLYDIMLMQDQINEMNSLMIQHMRYSTVGFKVYDANMIDIKDVVNDPRNGWIQGRAGIDKNITQAVHQLSPNALSPDVPNWIGALKVAMQDMSSAYDPSQGKGLGANTPYSQSVFLTEQAQGRWKSSNSYNKPELLRFHRNLLKIAKDEWVDERKKAVADHTGAWSFMKFQQADLKGQVDIILTNTDMQPKSRAEQLQGLQMFAELQPVIPTLPPKQKLRIEELMGMPPGSNPMSTQIGRAYRNIDKMKNGEQVQPIPFVDDPIAQVPVLQDFLASQEGDDLDVSAPEIWKQIYMYMQALMVLQIQQTAPGQQPQQGPGGQEGPPQGGPQAKKPGQPGGQPGQRGGGPNSAAQPNAQSPAPAPPVAPPSPNMG